MQPKPVVLYTRVSTEEQSKEGYSIEAQEKVLRAYCVVKGFENVTVYSDPGFSAKNTNRPALKEMLERIRQGGVEALIVWRLDRLSRSLKDTLHIVEDILQPSGTQLVSSSESIDTSTPSGRLMLNVLASFAQAERENTQERIRMVNTELAKTGHHLGGIPPFGYKVIDGKYIIDEPAAQAVRTLYQMFIDGAGYAAMAKYLRDNGFKTSRGNDFSKSSMHDILKNEKYTGVYIWNKASSATKAGTRNSHRHKQDSEIIRVPGAIPAIIPRPLWVKAQDTFRSNRISSGRFTSKLTYLLTGLIFCERCGSHMVIRSGSKDRDGTPQRYYVCPNRCCRAARKEDVEDFVLITLKLYLMQEDVIRAAIDAANTMAETAALEDAPEITRINASIEDITRRLEHITQYIAENGAQAPESLLTEMKGLEAQRTSLEIDRETVLSAQRRIDAQRVIDTLRDASDMINRPPDEQKALMRQTVHAVFVSDDTYRVTLDCSVDGGGEALCTLLERMGDEERLQTARERLQKSRRKKRAWDKRVTARLGCLKEPRERTALILRYVEGLRMEDAADAMGYCDRQVLRYIKRGLMHMEGLFET